MRYTWRFAAVISKAAVLLITSSLYAEEVASKDQDLAAAIQGELVILGHNYDHVSVTVKGGIVTLQGTVSSQADIDNLMKFVSGQPGVTSINNLLIIPYDAVSEMEAPKELNAKDSYLTEKDKQIVLEIRGKLLLLSSTKYESVRIAVVNGIVTLSGTVQTVSDANDALAAIKQIDGVQSINVLLTYANATS